MTSAPLTLAEIEEANALVASMEFDAKDFLDWNGTTMGRWDTWRAYIADGGKGSSPRDSFECLIHGVADDYQNAAKIIRSLLPLARTALTSSSERDAVIEACADIAYRFLAEEQYVFTANLLRTKIRALKSTPPKEPGTDDVLLEIANTTDAAEG